MTLDRVMVRGDAIAFLQSAGTGQFATSDPGATVGADLLEPVHGSLPFGQVARHVVRAERLFVDFNAS